MLWHSSQRRSRGEASWAFLRSTSKGSSSTQHLRLVQITFSVKWSACLTGKESLFESMTNVSKNRLPYL